MLAVAKLLTLLKLSKGIAVLLVNIQLQLGLKVHTITYLFLMNQYHMYVACLLVNFKSASCWKAIPSGR